MSRCGRTAVKVYFPVSPLQTGYCSGPFSSQRAGSFTLSPAHIRRFHGDPEKSQKSIMSGYPAHAVGVLSVVKVPTPPVFTPTHKHVKSRVTLRAHSHKAQKSRSSVEYKKCVHRAVPTICPLCYTINKTGYECKSRARRRALTLTKHTPPPGRRPRV